MKKSLFAIMTIGLFLVSSISAKHQMDDFAKFEQGKHEFKAEKRVNKHGFTSIYSDKFLKGLDLNSEQKQQIDLLQQETFAKTKAIFESASKLKSHFSENSFNKEAFLRDEKELSDTLINIRADYLSKVHDILTGEQKRKMLEILDGVKNKRGGK
jgi:Spy/CpxP family protein refolding chaperone